MLALRQMLLQMPVQAMIPYLLVVVPATLIALLVTREYWRYRHRRFEREEYHSIGLRKVKSVKVSVFLVCPRCRTPLISWDDVHAHNDPAESPCALMGMAPVEPDKPPQPWHAEQLQPSGLDTMLDGDENG